MKGRPYYIEFVGQHTAGKTTIIHAIVDGGLLEPRIAVYPQQLRRARWHFVLSLPLLILTNAHHLLFVAAFFVGKAKWQWTNYQDVARHIFKMVLLHPYYHRYQFDIWMKDDMLHFLPRILFREGIGIEKAFLQFFDHFAFLYDGLVFVEIPHAVMQERFAARFKTQSQQRKTTREPIYEHAFAQNVALLQVLKQQSKVPLLILDGCRETKENTMRVVSFINSEVIKN
ncbi:hypothetical protein H6783_02150 [Candidatus Nomurabacteria bacterium]|nr:hypothetical protein [Candidatus Nomurabacteria bacterium]